MKTYKITVNGITYDVTVEETGAYKAASPAHAPAPAEVSVRLRPPHPHRMR